MIEAALVLALVAHLTHSVSMRCAELRRVQERVTSSTDLVPPSRSETYLSQFLVHLVKMYMIDAVVASDAGSRVTGFEQRASARGRLVLLGSQCNPHW